MDSVADPTIRTAVTDAVNVVNTHKGETCVHVMFAGEPAEIDFIANSATLSGGQFEFRAGFETLNGSIEELAAIRAEIIRH